MAEKLLNLKFDKEYRQYLKEFGIVAYDGHELTGLTKSKRTNVVSVTKEELEAVKDAPKDMYVIERTNFEGIIIWQSEQGAIYYSSPNKELTKIYDSLREYLLA